MNTNHQVPAAPRRHFARIAGAIAIAAACAGAWAAAGPAGALPAMHGHHGAAMAMDMSGMAAHIHQVVNEALVDGTPEQKAAVSAIFRSAHADLQPIHAQLRQGHVRAHQLLTAPAIDRAALEELRVQQMQQLDAASKRMLTALEDVAEVLTPAQRARLAGHAGH